MNTFTKTLYKRSSTGAVQVWWMEIDGHKYRQHYGKKDGKIITKKWSYASPKNIGKINETTPEEQAILEVVAAVEKQLKSNYFENEADIDTGFLEPQLAKPNKAYIDKVDWKGGQIVDEKLNGIACIITKEGAFSRTNERFFAIPHILAELAFIFRNNPDAYIQGELFNPDYVNNLGALTELVAVTRKEKDITPELLEASEKIVQYHIYDGYNFGGIKINMSGRVRRNGLDAWFKEHKNSFISIKKIKYIWAFSFEEAKEFADEYIAKGGEGAIIRNPLAEYQHKRTKDLLKLKKFESKEFKVISIEEGTADWEGCAKFVWLELPDGTRDNKFKSNVKGSMPHLREVFQNRHYYVDKMVTVEFQELSPYNVPLIPYTDLLVRDYE